MKNAPLLKLLVIFLVIFFLSISCKKKDVPVLETTSVTNILGTTAISGGTIINDGDETITSRGVCWSKDVNPTISNDKTIDGAGAGIFVSNLADLDPASTYYVRAYATNANGTGYGMTLSFTTVGEIPALGNQQALASSTSSINVSVYVNPNYLPTTITIDYGLTLNYGNSVTATPITNPGHSLVLINAIINGLNPGTDYHIRVKAENSLGVFTGTDLIARTRGQLPTAITEDAASIQGTTATLKGRVGANDLSTIISFEYGLSTSYGSLIAGIPGSLNGSSITNVSVGLTGLTEGASYHFRVKASNSMGVSYGDDRIFTTLGLSPTASTQSAVAIFATTATLRGQASANYASTQVSFEYGTSTSYGSTISAYPSPLTGSNLTSLSAILTGLVEGTTYHYRLKATNSLGTNYGSDVSFTASGLSPISDLDGNSYKVVQIGTQVWMAENLKTTKYNDNTSIPLITDNTAWISLTTPGFCWYNNDASSFKDTYGALYNWFAVSTGKLCPTGWHVPSDEEFSTLTTFLGDINLVGGKIKETGISHWNIPNTGATNESGFSALPAGYTVDSGGFEGIKLYGIWWTSTPYNSIKPWYRSVGSQYAGISRGNGSLNQRGFSIRCVKN